VVAELEEEGQQYWAGKRKRRALGTSCDSQSACDLIIVDRCDPLDRHADLQDLLSQVRRRSLCWFRHA
jgi:hypothetical protein